MKNRYAIFILTGVMAVMLPSCAVNNDPGYQQWEMQVDTNPSPNDILGGWRHESNNDTLMHELHKSVLFQKGGKALWYQNDDSMGFVEFEKMNKSTWTYTGNGMWTSKLWKWDAELRITTDKRRLLIMQSGAGSTWGEVYVRQ